MREKPNAKLIAAAAEIAQLSLTDDQVTQLANGQSVKIDLETATCSKGRCSGVKITDLGNGCGLYLNWQNGGPVVSVCCEW